MSNYERAPQRFSKASTNGDGDIINDAEVLATGFRRISMVDADVPITLAPGVSALTFRIDDGLAGIMAGNAPNRPIDIFAKYGMPVVLAINPASIGATGKLTEEQLIDLAITDPAQSSVQALVEVGNHGYDHAKYAINGLHSPAEYKRISTDALAWFAERGIPVTSWINAGRGSVGAAARNTAYALGVVKGPSAENDYVYEVVQAGTTAAVAPAWPTEKGATVEDGTVVWKCLGFGSDTQGPTSALTWENTYFGKRIREDYTFGAGTYKTPIDLLPVERKYGISDSIFLDDSSGGATKLDHARRVMAQIAGDGAFTQLMWHVCAEAVDPNYGVHLNNANLEKILRHASALRLAGRLECMTFRQVTRIGGSSTRRNYCTNGSFERISPGAFQSPTAHSGLWSEPGSVPWSFDNNVDIHGGTLQTLATAGGVAASTTLASDAAANSADIVLTSGANFAGASASAPLVVEISKTDGTGQPYRIFFTGVNANTLTGCSRHPAFTASDGYTVRLIGRYATSATATTLVCTGAFTELADATRYWVRLLKGGGSAMEPLPYTKTDNNTLTLEAGYSHLVDCKGAVLIDTTTLFEVMADDSIARTGQMCVRFKGGPLGSTDGSVFRLQQIPVNPGGRYRISWWQRALTPALGLKLHVTTLAGVWDTAVQLVPLVAYSNTTQGVWQQMHCIVTIPDGRYHMRLEYNISGSGMGPMLLDDVEVVEE